MFVTYSGMDLDSLSCDSQIIFFKEYGYKMEPIDTALFPERRAKPRINSDYPAIVEGLDPQEGKFVEKARVINLSSGGAFVVTHRSIQNDAEVQVKIALPTGSPEWGTSDLETSGNVVRSEQQLDGAVGIAIKFQGYTFL